MANDETRAGRQLGHQARAEHDVSGFMIDHRRNIGRGVDEHKPLMATTTKDTVTPPSVHGSSSPVAILEDEGIGYGHESQTSSPQGVWRPRWLRRHVFAAFAVWSAMLVVAIEALAASSRLHLGIAEPSENLFYLWTFGPPAFFIVTGALWDRVSYQAMRFAPWIQLREGASAAAKTVLLDYNSILFAPTVIIAAVQNRHLLVANTIFTTLVLKILVVLSAGLMFRQATLVLNSNAVNFKDEFMTTLPDANANVTGDAIATLWEGMLLTGANPPEGYVQDFAIQTLDSRSSTVASNSTLRVVVDGVWSDISCEAGTGTEKPRPPESNVNIGNPVYTYNITVAMQSSVCGPPIDYVFKLYRPSKNDADNDWEDGIQMIESFDYFGPGGGSRCKNAVNPVFAHSFHIFNNITDTRLNATHSGNNDWLYTYNHTVSLFCQPKFYLGKVEVTRQGSETQVRSLSDPVPKLLQGDITRLVSSALSGGVNWTNRYAKAWHFQEYGIKDGFYKDTKLDVKDTFRLMMVPNPITKIRDINTSSITTPIKTLWRQFPALVANAQLKQQANTTVSGTVTVSRDRLLVQSVIPHVMAAILGIMCLLAGISAVWLAPASRFCPTDPETVLGFMVTIRNSLGFLGGLSGTATLGDKERRGKVEGTYVTGYDSQGSAESEGADPSRPGFRLSRVGYEPLEGAESDASHHIVPSWYEPFNTAVLPRVTMCVVLVAVIAGLASSLRVSQSSKGLAYVEDSAYIHYVWTSLPALVMVGIGLFFAAYDHQIRALSSFLLLRREVGATAEELNIAFADQTALAALVMAARRKAWPIAASTSASILVAFLTIFSATLFSLLPVQVLHDAQLQQEDWFASFGNSSPPAPATDSLWTVLSTFPDGTFDYPAWTYRDLIFPRLSAVPLPPTDSFNSSGTTATARVTALRPRANCTTYPASRVVYQPERQAATSFGIGVNLTAGADGQGWSSDRCGAFFGSFVTPDEQGYFLFADRFRDARHAVRPEDLTGCLDSTTRFVWGRYDGEAESVAFLATGSCSDYVEEVDVDLSLSWPSLFPDPANPPRPVESTARRSARFLSPPFVVSNNKLIPGSFNLSAPRYGLPYEYLGQEEHKEAVFSAVVEYWALFKARLMDSNGFRRLFNETVVAEKSDADLLTSGSYVETLNGPFRMARPAPINATLVGVAGRRLFQNEQPTYFLISLLSALLVLNTVSFWLWPRRLVPKNPRSIAAMASLVADSNVYDRLPPGVEWMHGRKVEGFFNGGRFHMGWFNGSDGDRAVYTIGLAAPKGG